MMALAGLQDMLNCVNQSCFSSPAGLDRDLSSGFCSLKCKTYARPCKDINETLTWTFRPRRSSGY